MTKRIASAIVSLIASLAIAFGLVGVPVIAQSTERIDIEAEWQAYHAEAVTEYADEFTALFNATEVKWAKNGRLMVKGANAKSFKFAAKGK